MTNSPTGRRQPGSMLDYSGMVDKDGKVDGSKLRQFLEFLERDRGNTNAGNGIVSVSRGTNAGALASGGAGSPGTQTPSSGSDTALYNQFMVVIVPTGNLSLYPGLFVNYTGGTSDPRMVLADNRFVDRFATHYVAAVNGGNATLSSVWGSALVRFASGKNTLNTPILYLYRDGEVTDDRSDIVDSRSRPQPGVVWDQALGFRIDRATGNSTARCSVTVPPNPRGPLG